MKKKFDEVFVKEEFKDLEAEDLINNLSGGLTPGQCASIWIACQLDQVYPCGGGGTSACELFLKYCK